MTYTTLLPADLSKMARKNANLTLVNAGDSQPRRKPLTGAIRPRLHTPFLRGETYGGEVAELAEKIGTPLLPWQRLVIDDILKIDKDGKFIRKTAGVLVARQNGKTHMVRMMIIWGLTKGEKILGISSDRGLALDTFLEVAAIIESNDFLAVQLMGKIRYSNGSEKIRFQNGGEYTIAAATRGASRGRTADRLYIDELREVKPEAWTAAKPVTRARPNAQTIITSNAGDAFSEVLNNLRNSALSYPPKSLGWYEYSAPTGCRTDDRQAWALANPSLGTLIDEQTLVESLATDSQEAIRTEMLCQWVDSLTSPFPNGVIEDTSDPNLVIEPGGGCVLSLDVSPSRRTGSLQIGKIQPDGRIALSIVKIWASDIGIDDLKIAADVADLAKAIRPKKILYDKFATASIIGRLEKSGYKCEDISGQAFYQACSELLDAFVNNRLVHSGQADLIQHFNNCAMKTNDYGWRIIRRKSAGDVTAAIGAAMIVHDLYKPQTKAVVISG